MKKILLTLVVLLLATPAWAVVNITAEADGCTVTVSFDATTEANLVRAFSLDIKLDNDANIVSAAGINADYYVFPGTIQIDASGNVTNPGTVVAEYGDLTSDTLPGLDSNGITIEMGSLYAPVGPGSPNAPAPSGALLTFTVDADCTVTITANVSRAGATGVVMEDPDEVVDVNLPDPLAVDECGAPPCMVAGDTIGDISITQAIVDLWVSIGSPPEWCCVSNSSGDSNLDEYTNPSDVVAIINNLGQATNATNYLADLNRDGYINPSDVVSIINNLGAYVGPCP
jgi:hypothetical protein